MKKMITILSALAVLVCGLTMSSCDDEVTNILAPANQWKVFPITKKEADGTTEKNEAWVAMYYTETEVTQKDITMKPGLTCLVWPATDGYLGIASGFYAIKTFEKDQKLTFDDDDTGEDSPLFDNIPTMNRAGWGVIYTTTKSKYVNATPAPVAENVVGGATYTKAEWDSIKDQFSWKKLLASYLLQ